eukprot:3250979-Prymnesium_polylepis.2
MPKAKAVSKVCAARPRGSRRVVLGSPQPRSARRLSANTPALVVAGQIAECPCTCRAAGSTQECQ